MYYVFADCVLDTRTYTLQRGKELVRLRPKVFDVCHYLLVHRQRVVSKDELIEQLWVGQYLSDATLESTIHEVRQALGDSRRAQRCIQTLRGRGYRFVVEVQEHPDDAAPVAQGMGRAPGPPVPGAEAEVVPQSPGVPARTPFLGREPELALFHDLLDRAGAGQGSAVCLVGEAGIGTSRLLSAVRQQAQERSLTCLQACAHPWGAMVPYLPFRALLRQQSQSTATDPIDVLQAQVERCLQAVALSPGEHSAALLALLGRPEGLQRLAPLRPGTRKVRIGATLRQLVLASSQQRPLLLMLQDVHWLDATSQHWLAVLVECLAQAPLLLLTTCRPDALPPWTQAAPVTVMRLAPLPPQQSQALLDALLAHTAVPEAVRQGVLAQAGGSPMFLEELAHLVTTPGAAERDGALPETLPGVIAARLAQLTEPASRLLQTAAILGPYAAWPVCQAIWGDQEAPGPLLAELQRQAFYTPPTATAELDGGFTHPLHWEVVYASLAPATRQHLHNAAARVLEAPTRLEHSGADDLLAYHQAHTAAVPLALEALHTVATRATAYGAYAEALSAIQEALPHVAALPPTEQPQRRAALVLEQARTLMALRRFQEACALLRPSPTQPLPPQDTALYSRWALSLSQASGHVQDWEQAVQYAQAAVAPALRSQDHLTLGQAYHVLAMACYRREDPVPGLAYSRQALDLLEHTADQEALAMASLMQGLNAFLSGDMPLALQAVAAAEGIGATRGEPQLQTYAAWLTGWMQATCGAWEESLVACQRSLALAVEPLHTAFARGWLGYAHLGQDNPEAARPLLEQALQQMHAAGYQRCAGLYTTLLALCAQRQGRLDTAQALAQQGFTLSRAAAHRLGLGWAQRALGLIAQALGAPAAAWTSAQDALATFAAIPARGEMAQTHLVLAQIAQAQDQIEPARQHVREAYGLFQALDMLPYRDRAARQAQTLGLTLTVPC